jgi:hypothetical protein
MFNNKKAQNALEFMIILVFVFVFIMLISYSLGILIADAKDDDTKQRLENFATSVKNEINTLINVEKGYYHEYEIYENDYYININNSYLIIQDYDLEESYFFEIKGDYEIKLFNKSSEYGEIRVISFAK